MVSVTSASRYMTSASRYHPHYQKRSSMFIRGLIPRNFAELADAVPIAALHANHFLDDPMGARGSENANCYIFEIPPKSLNLFLPYFKRSET